TRKRNTRVRNQLITNKRVKELKVILDALIEDARLEPEAGPKQQTLLDEAVTNFKAGGPELLAQATNHVWAYYRSVADGFDAEERAEIGIPEISTAQYVGDHVSFHHPPSFDIGGRNRYEPGRSYISFEGEVAWEVEHGLQLVFEHGRRVCKVGP